MRDHIHKKTQEFRMLKEADRVEVRKDELMKLEDKQQDVTRRKEMDRIIKSE